MTDSVRNSIGVPRVPVAAPPAGPDPVRALENTRRTLLKLVENIEAAIEAAREPARPSR